ncbi:TetR/AcrR family transcriptional regulator C-terminal domain-containing protein [Latilactobacillus sakei]
MQILLDVGFTPEQSNLAIESIDHFMSGLFADIAGEIEMKQRALSQTDPYLAQLPLKMKTIAADNHFDAFLKTFEHHRQQRQHSAEKFMLGLDIFLAGLEQATPFLTTIKGLETKIILSQVLFNYTSLF